MASLTSAGIQVDQYRSSSRCWSRTSEADGCPRHRRPRLYVQEVTGVLGGVDDPSGDQALQLALRLPDRNEPRDRRPRLVMSTVYPFSARSM